jgi:nucleoside-diphosphate-sugar epimerase
MGLRREMSTRRTVVLTGAAGVVGQALLSELEDHHVIALIHRETISDARADVVHCDVTAERLGLGPAEYDDLSRKADCIIHAAAVTDWEQPEELFQTVNVGGARNVLELARAADAPIYHMSTSFIRAIADDAPLALDPSHIIVNYVTSKRDTEELIAQSGVPATIFRPTNLIGDSRTGKIARTQVVQVVAEFLCRGKVPLFPTRPGTLVDVIPQDLFAKAVVSVMEDEDLGQEYWLTYGKEAMTVEEAVELCTEFMARIGQPIERPLVVDTDDVDSVRPELERLSPMSRAIFDRLVEFSDGMTACGVFPTTLRALQERYSLPDPSPRDAYVRGLEYWATSKGIWESAPT